MLLDPHELFRAVVALNALFASLAWCLARTNLLSVLSVLTFAVIWPFVDKPLGGRTVYTLDESNGITTGDFLSLFAVAVVAVLAARHWNLTRRRIPVTSIEQGSQAAQRETPNSG